MPSMEIEGKWKFAAQRMDYNRTCGIIFAVEQDRDLFLHELKPIKCNLGLEYLKIRGRAPITGNEPATSLFTNDEGQQLFDALYEAGFRPSRP